MGVWRYGEFEHDGIMEFVVELATTTGRGHLSTILSIIDDKRNKYVKTPISPAALAAVVRGLANFDPQSAFLAALEELQNQASPDRATFGGNCTRRDASYRNRQFNPVEYLSKEYESASNCGRLNAARGSADW
jgi:hypothetical protein